jgi:Peptidase propeptide and YPEB domain
MTIRTSRAVALTLTALLLASPAARAETEGMVDAATTAKVTADLTALGYDVRKLAMEDGAIEVYAIKDGKTCELYLAADLTVAKEECK